MAGSRCIYLLLFAMEAVEYKKGATGEITEKYLTYVTRETVTSLKDWVKTWFD